MEELAEIHEKIKILLDQLRNGDIYESLPELLYVLKENVDLNPAEPTPRPHDSTMALEQMHVYQEAWSDNEGEDQQLISDSDLRFFVHQLASPSAKIRDTGTFFFLGNAIQSGHLNSDQMAWLTAELINDEILLCQILEEENDGAYGRSFSVALLSILLTVDQQLAEPFISVQLKVAIVEQISLFALLEVDTRGFVPGHGWVHAFTHLANVMGTIFDRTDIPRANKLFMVACLMTNFRHLNTALTMGEIGRLVGVILKLTQKHSLYAEYFLLSLKLWRQDLVNEPFAQTRSRWQKLYIRVDFFQQILAYGPEEVPEKIWAYVQETKNYLS
ncbi:DUF2785 domain-containing protein [Fructobacillus ficulneus]|uniref:DUF2785 domain-containing protein n=1 Tax=Fructobacillus ficulneus TaxID=157463 RepID=A0A0K8MFS4_9LACO|nr:DUF2785 domain-containing protein [Fructobacillus ficulneus]GAO99391.1 hypothetical protein FFIC_092240 [Fructobacillus ficulneus]